MTSPEHIIQLREQRKALDKWGADLEETIEETQRELEVVEKLKAVNSEASDDLKAAARRAGRRRVTLDDIRKCETQREILRFVAVVSFGLAHLGEVAELVIDARRSRAEKDSVRSTLYHYVSDSEDFVHIGKSWVWLLECGPAPTLEEVEAEEAPQDQGDDGARDGAASASEAGADSEPGSEPVSAPGEFGEKAA